MLMIMEAHFASTVLVFDEHPRDGRARTVNVFQLDFGIETVSFSRLYGSTKYRMMGRNKHFFTKSTTRGNVSRQSCIEIKISRSLVLRAGPNQRGIV